MHNRITIIPRTLLLTFLLVAAPVQPRTQAQFRESQAGPERFAGHMLESANEVFAWYDAPVFLAYIVNRFEFVPPTAKPVSLEASEAEEAIARSLAVSGSVSVGSLEPFTIPHLIIGAQLAHAVGSELFVDGADARGELRNAMGLYKTLMYTQVATQTIKNLVHRVRPDGSDDKSFFSGHSSISFATAAYLQREADDALAQWEALENRPVLRNVLRAGSAAVLYGWSGYVGYSRMRDNKHFLSDVAVGALVGAVIGNLVYDGLHAEGGNLLPTVSVWSDERGPQIALQMQF